ncbi:GGDEF and EAL domain-containing protein [Photobacterium atrarenae]|uniref:EAL domain-containing protein n=1 Tax=Photobacterium atrarenae TaxID=865757 RepID=A0ABY5GJJ8_9GAMM|nr:GGDEF and EAL domain-containing protein [Photobacterium atrarenae]UTV29498.1 EAL domain-containing protein [Photobacterium atrarenae]
MEDVLQLLPVLEVEHSIVTACNEAFTEQVGYSPQAVVGKPLASILSQVRSSPRRSVTVDQFLAQVARGGSGELAHASLSDSHHYPLPVKVHCACHGEPGQYRLCFQILENKSVDPITGLRNGWAIRCRTNHLLEVANRHPINLALIVLSVDNFSAINFRYDFDIGDLFLTVVGQKLQQLVGSQSLVVRYSNAKFGLLVEDQAGVPASVFNARVSRLCKALCQIGDKPLQLSADLTIQRSVSIGVSAEGICYPDYHAMEVAAENALQEAKKVSLSNFVFAEKQISGGIVYHKLIIDAFPQAIENHQIQIHYQPQYSLSSGRLIGLEALSRWHHAELGYIAPDVFVAIAEEIGLHYEFDLWVFQQVCRQLAAWQHQQIPVAKVAINISFKTLEMATFIERLEQILAVTHCPTDHLELEITETANARNITQLRQNIVRARHLGISIAVDDFGTGYSSLQLIRNFCRFLDKLKLDRTLTENICNTALDREFVQQIIALSRVLNVKVLAEGVETSEQAQLLRELGCNYAQGYYYHKALPAHAIEPLLCQSLAQVHQRAD